MRKVWVRLGRPDAIGWPVVAIFVPQVFLGSYAATFVDVTGRLPDFTWARLVSTLAMVAVLLLGRLALNIFAHTTPRPEITMFFMVATVATGASAQNGMLVALGVTDVWNIGQRLILAGPGLFALLLVACIIVSSARESARQNSELADVAKRLAETRGRTQELAQEKGDQLLASIRAEIDQALRALSTSRKSQVKANLSDLLDDVVRPMSYRLSTEIAPLETPPALVTSEKISWPKAFRGALEKNPAHPHTTTAWLAILVGSYLVTSLGLPGLLAALFSGGLAWISLFVLRRSWSHTRGLSLGQRATLYSGVILLYSIGSAVGMTEISGYNFLLPHSFIGFVLLSLSMGWTISLVYGLNHSLDQVHLQLQTTVSELQRDVVSLTNDVRERHKRFSRVLHGPIQSALLALIQRIDKDASETQISSELAEFQQSLEAALSAASTEAEAPSSRFDDALSDLVEFWDEIAAIAVSIDPRIPRDLHQNHPCLRVTLELIREAIGNAIKHGQAKTITVSVAPNDAQGAIELVVDNDGRALGTSTLPGVGSRLFDESCLSWSRHQVGPLVRLKALVPTLG